jgi:hypothetical protein
MRLLNNHCRNAGDVEPISFPPAGGSTIDPWVTPPNVVAHPNAAANGNGPGSFQNPAQLGTNGNVFGSFPHPQAPGSQQLDPADLQDKAQELQTAPQKPPPLITQDETKTINGISVTIKTDQMNASGVTEGEGDTAMAVDPGSTPGFDHDGPADESKIDKKKNKVTKIVDPMPVITATIQTRYKSSSSPAGKSAYGRGTTEQDKKDGNTSLGFHESCHRQDHMDFVKNNALPKFGGKVGQTIEAYESEVDKYNDAVTKYQDKSAEESEKTTDQVGSPTKAEFDAKNKP